MTSPPTKHGAGASDVQERWPRWMPDFVWAPLASAALMLIVGGLGLVAGQPWLYPSLGPVAFTMAEYPAHKTARFYNVLAGNLCGVAAGVLAVAVLQAHTTSSITVAHQLTPVRLWAVAIAVVLTIVATLLLRASQPPAVGTAMLFALGSLRPNVHDCALVMAGVLIVAAAGEGLRRLRLAHASDARLAADADAQ